MKKTISLLLVAVLVVACMTTTAFAAHAGDTNVSVTIYASGEGFANFSCDLSIPSVVESVSDTFSFSNGSGDFFNNKIAFATGGAILTGDVAVLTISVNIKNNAAPDTYYFNGTNISAYDDNGEPTTISVYGSVTISCNHVAGEAKQENYVAPSCTTEGSYDMVVRCTLCDEKLATEEHVILPATGHAYDNGVVTTPATCTTAGVKTYTCANDASHTYTEEIAATGHAYDNGVVTTPATCTTAGVKTYTCANDASHTYTEEIPATGHDYVWTDNKDGKTHTVTCKNCDYSKVEDHYYPNNDNVCVCGYEKNVPSETTTPPTKPGGGGDMGDTTPYPVFFMMAIAAVMGTAYGFKRKFEI